MTENPAPVELPWRRLHPFSPLLRGGLFLLIIAGIVVANLRDRLFELFFGSEVVAAMGPNESDLIDYLIAKQLLVWFLVAVLVVIGLIVGFSWLSWRFSTFRITAEAVESRRGVIFRQHRRAPLDRIQSVNLQRSLLARVLGLTQVDVQTGGQGGKVDLQYLGHRDAKAVREQILLAVAARRQHASRSATDVATEASAETPTETSAEVSAETETETEATATSAATISATATAPAHSSAVDFAGEAYGATSTLLDNRIRDLADSDVDPHAREAGSLISVPLGRLIGSIALSTETMIIVAVTIGVALLSIWSTPFFLASVFPLALVLIGMLFSQFNRGFNFVLSRAPDGVRVGAGFSATTTETIPFGRVHAVEALQPLGWRPFGWWKVRITTAGHSVSQAGQNKLMNTVLPVGHVDEVARVFELLLHSEDSGAEDRAAKLREALAGVGDEYLRSGPRAWAVLLFGTRRAGLRIAGGQPVGQQHERGQHEGEQPEGEQPESERLDQVSLNIMRGWFTRSLTIMPIVRAQSVQFARPGLHRFLGLASLQAHTVLGPVRMQMRGIALDDARRAFVELSKMVVRVQGAEQAGRVEQSKCTKQVSEPMSEEWGL